MQYNLIKLSFLFKTTLSTKKLAENLPLFNSNQLYAKKRPKSDQQVRNIEQKSTFAFF